MPEAKGVLEGLTDFSFRLYATPRMLKFLYALHLLMGLIAEVAWVVLALRQSPVQGLLALLAALVGYFLWILCSRATQPRHDTLREEAAASIALSMESPGFSARALGVRC